MAVSAECPTDGQPLIAGQAREHVKAAVGEPVRRLGEHPGSGLYWLVAAPQPERVCYFEQFEEQEGWSEILREPSPRNEGQQKNARTAQRVFEKS